MSIVQNKFPTLYRAYLLVAEPRIVRLILFAIYIVFLIAGGFVLTQPPENFVEVITERLVLMLGCFLALGGILSSVAVLPGLWWLERCGLLSLITGMLIYIVVIVDLQSSPLGICVSIAFILFFILRYMETRQSKLAPRKK